MISPKHVASGTGDVDSGIAAANGLRLRGYSIAETAASAAAAEVKLHHGTTATGILLVAPINLAADGHGGWHWGADGIACPNGIFVERIAGTTELVIYYDMV
jgi:hypothetical protein